MLRDKCIFVANIFHEEAKLGNKRSFVQSAGSFVPVAWLIRFEISISLTGKQKANKFEVFVGKHDGACWSGFLSARNAAGARGCSRGERGQEGRAVATQSD